MRRLAISVNTQAGEAESDGDFVAQTDFGCVLACADELSERFVVREPASGVLGLHLAVGASVGAERAVAVSHSCAGVLLDETFALAPAQERQDFRRPLIDGVVRRVPRGAIAEKIGFGQVCGMVGSGVPEQAAQRGPIIKRGLSVRIPTAELVDDLRKAWWGQIRDGSKRTAFP
jgi:hypothetical protein